MIFLMVMFNEPFKRCVSVGLIVRFLQFNNYWKNAVTTILNAD
jgi:hypothetical protein